MNKKEFPIYFTNLAIKKIKKFMVKKNKNLKFRIYITGGGCSGFKYGFTFDNIINRDDLIFEKYDIILVIDAVSLQYLFGSSIDYYEELEGSHFVVINPNAKTTCSCGSSFNL